MKNIWTLGAKNAPRPRQRKNEKITTVSGTKKIAPKARLIKSFVTSLEGSCSFVWLAKALAMRVKPAVTRLALLVVITPSAVAPQQGAVADFGPKSWGRRVPRAVKPGVWVTVLGVRATVAANASALFQAKATRSRALLSPAAMTVGAACLDRFNDRWWRRSRCLAPALVTFAQPSPEKAALQFRPLSGGLITVVFDDATGPRPGNVVRRIRIIARNVRRIRWVLARSVHRPLARVPRLVKILLVLAVALRVLFFVGARRNNASVCRAKTAGAGVVVAFSSVARTGIVIFASRSRGRCKKIQIKNHCKREKFF